MLSDISDDALRNLYQSASLAIFSFRDATANNALLEAMACGLPIVATDVGGVSEYTDDDSATLCRPGDPEDLANAVNGLLANAEVAATRGDASRRRALRYDYRNVARNMKSVYAGLLSG